MEFFVPYLPSLRVPVDVYGWYSCFSYESNSRSTTGSVFVCLSMFAHNLLIDCTKFKH